MKLEHAMGLNVMMLATKPIIIDCDWYDKSDKYGDHYTRIDLRICTNLVDELKKIGEIYHVRVWKDENSFFDLGRACDRWFAVSNRSANHDPVEWSNELLESAFIPREYKKDIRTFVGDGLTCERRLLTNITGMPFPIAKWGNPRGKVLWKGKEIDLPYSTARELSEYFIRIRC